MAIQYTRISTLSSQQEEEVEVKGIPSNTEKNFNNRITGESGTSTDFTNVIGPEGDFSKLQGINVIINSLRNLLLTPLRSYIFDPTYGSLLYQKVFDPADDITAREIEYEVVTRITEFDNRVNIRNVQTEFFNNKKGFRVTATIERDKSEASIKLIFNENTSFSLEEG